MRFVFLAGGCAGFALTATASFLADHTADRVLFDAAVGCLAGSLLFRWFWAVLMRGFREVIIARNAAAAAAAEAEQRKP